MSALAGLSGHIFDHISLSGNVQAHFGDAVYHYSKNIDEIERACLQALRCPDSFAVKTRLKEHKDKILYQSFEWILKDTKYTSWKNGKDIALLWIKGGAGKGKTMMSIGLIEELTQNPEQPATVAYFFCQNADYELNSVEAIVKGLILQLIQQQRKARDCLMKHWDVSHQRLTENMRSWRGLWDAFLEMVEQCPLNTKVYIIIDGLDECRDDGMADLLRIIVRTGLTHPARVKWLLTSRPLTVAERELLAGSDQVRIDLELNLRSVSKGIRGYIKHKVLELDHRWQYGPELRRVIEHQLTVKAEDTFLWVSLVCKCLENVGPGEVLATIRELPPDLRGLYHRVYTDMYQDQSPVAKGCVRVLSAMILALRPLTMAEISMVADISLERDFVSAIIDRIALFAIVPRDHIEFVHQSARDYLLELQKSTEARDPEWTSGHGEMALRCLNTLSRRLRVDLLDLRRPDATREMMDKAGKDMLANLNYAATYWVWHLRAAQNTMLVREALAERGAVVEFLVHSLLPWVECLSLIDHIDFLFEALYQLVDMSVLLSETESQSTLGLIASDAISLLLPNREMLSKWPLQVHSSSIVFSPQENLFRSLHVNQVPSWLINSSYSGEKCVALVDNTSFEHATNIVTATFAAREMLIITAHRDSTVKFYNVNKRHIKITLRYDGSVEKMCLSHDEQKIISVTNTPLPTIAIRDINTAEWLLTIEIPHTEKVLSVAISPDGNWIVSGSADKTLRIWNATTGELKRTLTGHKNYVQAVAVSSDGRWIGSGSDDCTVKIWDFTTGRAEKTLIGHPGFIRSLAFSPNGKYLASGCVEGFIKVWTTSTGTLEKSLGGQRSIVTTVKFSLGSERLVSGSDQGLIRVWNVKTGHSEQRLTGHTGEVFSIALVENGRSVISFANDRSVKVWDISPGSGDDLIDSIQSVAFSPNGQYVASTTEHRISIYDVSTGKVVRTLDDRSNRIKLLAWSQDSKLLLAGSCCGCTEVWDVTFGTVRYYITHKTQRVTAAAFSSDGRFIAIGFLEPAAMERTPTFAVWDVTTGQVKNVKIKTNTPENEKFRVINAITPFADGWRVAAWMGWTTTLWIGDTMQASPKIGWKRQTTEERIILKGRRKIRSHWPDHLRFSADGTCISTDRICVAIDAFAEQTCEEPDVLLDLSVRRSLATGSWICYGDTYVIRLPPELIPTSYHVYEDHIAVGFNDGQMLIFTIDRRQLVSEAKSWS